MSTVARRTASPEPPPPPPLQIRSVVFPGLWLAAAALIEGRLNDVQAVLARGLADPSHAAFAAKLGA